MAAGATVGLVKKMVSRYRRGAEIPRILEDPPEVRTLARLVLDDPARAPEVLAAMAAALDPDIEAWIGPGSVVLARRPGDGEGDEAVEVLRLAQRDDALFTLELTRAWTGPRLGPATRALLVRLHEALARHPAVRELAWHWRQDRGLVVAHPVPVAGPSGPEGLG